MKLLRISQYVGSNYVIALLGFMMSFLTTKLVGPDYFGLLASILLYSDWLHILILLGLDQSFLRYGINWDVGAKIGFIQSLISILFLILIYSILLMGSQQF